MNLTPDELVKALRRCASGESEDCPFSGYGVCGCPAMSANQIERDQKEIAELREKAPQWIPVTERLPEPETDVLAVCNRNGYIFVVPAIYEDGKMPEQDSVWNWIDIYDYGVYDEETDNYYVPEGWWENRRFNPDDVYNNLVDCAVTHWMPLPEPPKEDTP